MLSAKCGAIGHCFEAFPLLIEEAKKRGRTVRPTLLDEIAAKQTEFKTDRIEITKTLGGRLTKVDDFTPCNEKLTNWATVIVNFLKEIFLSAAPAPVPGPVPVPVPVPDPVPVPVPVPDPAKQNLEAELDAAKKEIDRLNGHIKELEEKLKPKPIRFKGEPEIVGTNIEFKPVK